MSHLQLTVAAEPDRLGLVRHAVETWLTAMGWSREDMSVVVFVISEAMSNSIEHAYRKLDLTAGRVIVCLHVEPDGPGQARASMTVRDEGRWRPELEGEADRGNGLSLIRALLDTVTVTTDETGTRVDMVSRAVELRRGTPPAAL